MFKVKTNRLSQHAGHTGIQRSDHSLQQMEVNFYHVFFSIAVEELSTC